MDSHEKEAVIWKTRFFKYGAIVLGLILFTVFLMACKFFMQAVLTVVLTAVFTFVLSKPVKFFESKGINRGLGTILALVIAFLFIVVCLVAFIPPILEQTIKLVQAIPGYAEAFQRDILPRSPELQKIFTEENLLAVSKAAEDWLSENGGNLANGALSIAGQVAGGIGYAFGIGFVTIILTMTLLIDLPQLSKDFMSIFNDENKKAIRMFSKALGDSFYGWLTMMSICGFTFGLVVGIILSILDVPYAAIVGLFCFIAFFIPSVGPIIAALAAALAGLCQVWWMAIVAFLITFIVATIIQSTLQPNLTQSRVNINPGIALFAGMVGGIIWGPIGILIGVPIYACIQAVFVEYCREYKGKELATPESVLFVQVDPDAKKGSFLERAAGRGRKKK